MAWSRVHTTSRSPFSVILVTDKSGRVTFAIWKQAAMKIVEDTLVFRMFGVEGAGPLAAAYREILADETPARRLERFLSLAKADPGHVESRLAVAEAALDARVWTTARSQLEALATSTDTAAPGPEATSRRFCRLMARLEEDGENNPIAGARWADRARAAPEGDVWHCRRCGAETADWVPRYGHCGAFDGLAWGPPEAGPFRQDEGAGAADLWH